MANACERRRFSGRREAAVGLGVYALYLAVRRLKLRRGARASAAVNAERVVALERRLGIHVEPGMQRLLLPRTRLVAALNVAYVTLNVGLTVGWLMYLFRRRDAEFHRLRRAAVAATLGAQPVFLFFPVAPPRTLAGFVDTIEEVSGVDLDRGLVAELYDPIAAVPSIHVAYAVVTAAGIASTARRRHIRALAPAYPPLVALVVLATANHYVVDALAGAVLGRLALRAASGGRGIVGRPG
ncbi:MAG: phosphatase PAP2 family protein [Thermoleophilia bacterium]|nr:phosphatase PAP2 family protein [Thermoleophilia bacterium]